MGVWKCRSAVGSILSGTSERRNVVRNQPLCNEPIVIKTASIGLIKEFSPPTFLY